MIASPLTLAVVSGKGGVGKSVLAVNLAETLAAMGLRTALIDADLGQSACPILLNEAPAATVAEVARGDADLRHTLHETAGGVTLMQGARTPDGMPPEAALFRSLDDGFEALHRTHDAILIDAPAGAGPMVRWALERAGAGLLVLVGEPTAVADAYALTKLVWGADPDFPLGAIVNHADTEAQAQDVADRFAAVTQPFLGRAPAFLGWIPYTVAIRASVYRQTPAIRENGSARLAFESLADVVASGPLTWSETETLSD